MPQHSRDTFAAPCGSARPFCVALASPARADDDATSEDKTEGGDNGDDKADSEEEEAHPAAPPAPDPLPDDYVILDAGFWLNYTYNLFDKTDRDKRGDFGPGNSMFRVGFATRFKGFLGAVRLRWYSYARVWEYGWMGYRWAGGSQLEVGMTKVPFGLLPFGSYDYWFRIALADALWQEGPRYRSRSKSIIYRRGTSWTTSRGPVVDNWQA